MMTTEITTKRKKLKSVLAPLYLTATIFGSAMFFHAFYKVREFETLQEKYVQAVEADDNGLCSPIASTVDQWCQENYFSVKGVTLRAVDEIFTIKPPPYGRFLCETARHNKVFYGQHIQLFLHQLDLNKALQQELERKIYDIDVEIGMNVHRDKDRDNYTISYTKDESDGLFQRYFALMENDEQLQDILMEITRGDVSAVTQYIERVKEMIEYDSPKSNLERTVQEEIGEQFQGGDTYDVLVALAETGLEYTKLEKSSHQEVVQLAQVTSRLQELKNKYKKIIDLWEERQSLLANSGRTIETQEGYQQITLAQQELQRTTLEAMDYTRQLEQAHQNELGMPEKREEFYQDSQKSLWQHLRVELVDGEILKIQSTKQKMNTFIIAEGHTHPYKLVSKASTMRPSRADQQGSFKKPELVFAGLEDKWQVYSTICGQVVLEREYPRTINPSSAPDTFLNPHLK